MKAIRNFTLRCCYGLLRGLAQIGAETGSDIQAKLHLFPAPEDVEVEELPAKIREIISAIEVAS